MSVTLQRNGAPIQRRRYRFLERRNSRAVRIALVSIGKTFRETSHSCGVGVRPHGHSSSARSDYRCGAMFMLSRVARLLRTFGNLIWVCIPTSDQVTTDGSRQSFFIRCPSADGSTTGCRSTITKRLLLRQQIMRDGHSGKQDVIGVWALTTVAGCPSTGVITKWKYSYLVGNV